MELLLEPNSHKAAKAFQMAILEDSIPATALFANDLQIEFERTLIEATKHHPARGAIRLEMAVPR